MMDSVDIHVIDDDESSRNGISRLCKAGGYEVKTYSSTEDFVSSNQSEISGCVLLDSSMPGKSGEDFALELTKMGKAIPVIFITADDNPLIKEKAEQVGAAGFFRKPVDGAALLDVIAWTLRKAKK